MGASGLKVSHLALGTMTWGVETDADEAAAQLVAFHDAGGTLVDTAASYGYGETEELIGGLLADVVPRANLQLATKAGIVRTPEGRVVDCSRGALLRQLDDSLRKLGTDYVDLWYVHSVDDTVPFDETLGALDAAVSSGKVRYAGVSNYSGWRIGQAAAWQRAVPGRAPIVANQVRWSLADRGVEREVVPGLPRARRRVVPLVAARWRRAHRQVPRRRPVRLARRGRAPARPRSRPTPARAASSKPSPPRPRVSPPHPSRWRSRGSATVRA